MKSSEAEVGSAGAKGRDGGGQTAHRRRRLSPSARRFEILAAARTVFVEKGYTAATMKDLIRASGLSPGGFYHYYRDKSDVLYDLMREGNRFRFEHMTQYLAAHPDLTGTELLAELLLDKLFDDNDFKPIYAVFLSEMAGDDRLKALYERMMEDFIKVFVDFTDRHGLGGLQLLTGELAMLLMNCILLGVEVMRLRPYFTAHREPLKQMLMRWFEYLPELGTVCPAGGPAPAAEMKVVKS